MSLRDAVGDHSEARFNLIRQVSASRKQLIGICCGLAVCQGSGQNLGARRRMFSQTNHLEATC